MLNVNIEKSAVRKARAPQTQDTAATGACIYIAGRSTKCDLLTRPECNRLAGIWLPERDCGKILKMELAGGAHPKTERTLSR
jgi:hypothetical protein